MAKVISWHHQATYNEYPGKNIMRLPHFTKQEMKSDETISKQNETMHPSVMDVTPHSFVWQELQTNADSESIGSTRRFVGWLGSVCWADQKALNTAVVVINLDLKCCSTAWGDKDFRKGCQRKRSFSQANQLSII